MKILTKISLFIVALMILAGCQGNPVSAGPEPTATSAPTIGLAGTTWDLVALGSDILLPGTAATLQFGADGTVSGTDGCNQFTSTFVQDGNNLTITQPASTMMACQADVMNQAANYLDALARTTTFSANERQLILQEGNRIVATFSVSSQALEGTSWAVTAYNNGNDAVVSLVLGTDISFEFGNDGLVSGNAGCNEFFAGFSAQDGTITIDQPGSTMRFCVDPAGVMEQEAAFLAASESATTYSVQGNLLEMRRADDQIALVLVEKTFVDLPAPPSTVDTPWGRVTAPHGLNVRSGPGVNFPVIGVAQSGDTGEIIGRSADSAWWAVSIPVAPEGIGWVSTDFVLAMNVENVPVLESPAPPVVVPTVAPATPTPVPAATATPQAQISFTVDQTAIDQGQCTALRWSASNVEAIWINPSYDLFDRTPRPSQGSQQVCPASTTTYEMRVQHRDGTITVNSVTVDVRAAATPEAQISFWADRTTIDQGQCTRLYWHVENVDGVWVYPQGERFDRFPRVGNDSERVCPNSTTTYEMRVQQRDGNLVFRQVTINVNQIATATPVPPTATPVPLPSVDHLAGTRWTVAQFSDGSGVVSVLPDTEITVDFNNDGTVTGNSGCNTFSASYLVTGDAISINQPGSTSRYCAEPEGTMDQEFAFLSALQSGATFRISGNTLTINNASGLIAVILNR